MNIGTFIRLFETKLPTAQAEDFDNVGLLCGNLDREISKILVCHDVLETVLEEAIEKQCNMIVCFHPIIFKGIKKITGKNYVERVVLKAIENKIAIYAVHTALDNDFFGVNENICQQLGVKSSKILIPKKNALMQLEFFVPNTHTEIVKQALFSVGAGKIGFYDQCSFSIEGLGTFRPLEGANPFLGNLNTVEYTKEDRVSVVFDAYKKSNVVAALHQAHPYEEIAYQLIPLANTHPYMGLGKYGEFSEPIPTEDFLKKIKEIFQVPVLRYGKFKGKEVRRVAVLGGSGSDGIEAAIANNCDAYLTADLKYHDFFRAENKLLLCDVGHFESERFVVSQIIALLSEKFPNFAILKSEVNTNPVNYF